MWMLSAGVFSVRTNQKQRDIFHARSPTLHAPVTCSRPAGTIPIHNCTRGEPRISVQLSTPPQVMEMGRFVRILVIGALAAVAAGRADAAVDNVATQWSYLASVLICALPISTGPPTEPNILLAHLHLAQWHALIALRSTGAATTEDVVVAYASHKVMATYFPLQQVGRLDPLLDAQLALLRVSAAQQKLGKQLGQAVALDLVAKTSPAREFTLQALKHALDADARSPRPGLYRYPNNTPAGRAAQAFLFYDTPLSQPFVIPAPATFIKAHLPRLIPPKVPSSEYDAEYASVVTRGRADAPQRTPEMNSIAVNSGCLKVNDPSTPPLVTCFSEETWAAIARATLAKEASLYDTVTVLAKLHVAMHDTFIVLTTLQYGFWNWRPEMAFKAGDARHAPIPEWTPFIPTPPHAEYPSAAVGSFAAAAAVLAHNIGARVAFSLPDGGVWGPGCPIQGAIRALSFGSFREYVRYMQLSRVYAGAHFNKSVEDAVAVGESVARFVEANWGVPVAAGVLPSATWLSVVAKLPDVQTGFDPIRLMY